MRLGLDKTQIRALSAAWLGWAFDGLDGFLYVMVGRPFVTQLVAREHGVELAPASPALAALSDEITIKFTIIGAVFLIGWACGGALFGRIGDRLGRARTLTLTVLTYALFTGLCYFAQSWWQLMLFRFVAALGIGGEWAAGSALVSETLPARHRFWASAALQSAYMFGCIAAALAARWLAPYEQRVVFLVGLAPALLTVWIRRAVPEPQEWRALASEHPPPPMRALLSPDLRRTTLLTILLTAVPLTTIWAFWLFLPEVIRAIPEVHVWSRPAQQQFIARVTVSTLLLNVAGNFFAVGLARIFGFRAGFTLMFLAGLLCFGVGFAQPPTLDNIHFIAGITSFFIFGVFGMFPLYITQLFPTLLRTLGCGITYNAGRLISAAGTFGAGWLTIHTHGPVGALWWVGMLYVPGLLVALQAPRPRFEPGEADPVAASALAAPRADAESRAEPPPRH